MSIAKARHFRASRGATLVEAVIFIMIISIAVAGILLVMNNTTRHSADPQLRKQALAIAESLLEEIELSGFTYCDGSDPQAPFATAAVVGPMGPGGYNSTQPPLGQGGQGGCTSGLVENPGPETGNTRPFDNVNDYVSSLGTVQNYVISDVNGTAVSNFTGNYKATVEISQATLPNMTADPGANPALGSALLITVTVNYVGGSITLDGYRTQYAPDTVP